MKNFQLAINGLSWATSERELLSLFSKIGKVLDVTLIKNPLGDSIGSAFITMKDESDAETAIEDLNGKVIDGNSIRVKVTSLKDESRNKALLSNA